MDGRETQKHSRNVKYRRLGVRITISSTATFHARPPSPRQQVRKSPIIVIQRSRAGSMRLATKFVSGLAGTLRFRRTSRTAFSGCRRALVTQREYGSNGTPAKGKLASCAKSLRLQKRFIALAATHRRLIR